MTVFSVGTDEPLIPRKFIKIGKEEFSDSSTLNILENVRQTMKELIKVEGKEKVFEFLKDLLGKNYAKRKHLATEDNLYGTVAAGSLYLLPAMIVKNYSLIVKEEKEE